MMKIFKAMSRFVCFSGFCIGGALQKKVAKYILFYYVMYNF